jgi:hypothetical protein
MNEQLHSEEHSEGAPTPKQLKDLYRGARDPVFLRAHLHIVWRLSLGEPLGQVAQMSGYSTKWVKEILRRYQERGEWRALGIGATTTRAGQIGRCWVLSSGRGA